MKNNRLRYTPSLEEFISRLSVYGDVGRRYLDIAFPRMCITRNYALERFTDAGKARLLDIGAHWLHSSALYALEGVSVTAADMEGTGEFMTHPVIQGIAREFGIKQITYKDLSDPVELRQLPADSFEVILFSEILEHITFNPVKMWVELYRLLSPNGRIVVTTPNYFHFPNVARDFLQSLRGSSPGIPMKEIVGINTYGHHWKLYSVNDIKAYFKLLSPDFSVERVEYYSYSGGKTASPLRFIKETIENTVPFFREALYLEIALPQKKNGILATPGWG